MASRTIITLTDDIDGGEAAETVTFALDGIAYEIDLSEQNASTLRQSLSNFIAAGRRVGKAAGAGKPGKAPAPARSASDVDTKAVREWARGQGMEVNERGRISAQIVEAFRAAQNGQSPAPAVQGAPAPESAPEGPQEAAAVVENTKAPKARRSRAEKPAETEAVAV